MGNINDKIKENTEKEENVEKINVIDPFKEDKNVSEETLTANDWGLIGTSITSVILIFMLIFQKYFKTFLDIKFSLLDAIQWTDYFDIIKEESLMLYLLSWGAVFAILGSIMGHIKFIYKIWFKNEKSDDALEASVSYISAMIIFFIIYVLDNVLLRFTGSAWISIILSIANIIFYNMYNEAK